MSARKNKLTQKIKDTIALIMYTDINGCITGSSMIPKENFDEWDSVPDVDVFVYKEPQLQYAANLLIMSYGFEPASEGDNWKYERIKNMGVQKSMPLSTIKVSKDGVIVNITYKKNKTNLFSVLSSFDMSIIMIGVDIPTKVVLDLRKGWPGMVMADPLNKWSDSVKKAVPNPLRKQDVDMYGVEMWVRQFDRVIKYWDRGFDTRPMAEFYVDLINDVLRKGQLFQTDKSEKAYQEFVTLYKPLRDKMVQWLDDRKDI